MKKLHMATGGNAPTKPTKPAKAVPTKTNKNK